MAPAVPTQPVETPPTSQVVAPTEMESQPAAAPTQISPQQNVTPAAEVQSEPPKHPVDPGAPPMGGSAETVVAPSKTKQNSQELDKSSAPQDRTLELNGLQALMQQQKIREAAAQGERVVARIDWTTHRKEGMRLKRLMEESADGAKFPHMQQMFSGSKEEP